MKKKNINFQPKWINEAPKKYSFRSIFKYGAPNGFKHPSKRLVDELKRVFEMNDEDFAKKISTGNKTVSQNIPYIIDSKHIKVLEQISGQQNVSILTFDRLKYSTGKTMEEQLMLRNEKIEKISDLVVHPRNKKEITEIVKYCNENIIPIYVYGGGSSVNKGFFPEKGGVTMVLSTHLNKIIELNETNQTVRVEAGMMGKDFEQALNNAPKIFNTKRKYTCGHFPQSFEYSTAGGWFVTLGSGQASSYYGDAADLVLSAEIVTPIGTIISRDFPAEASGPKILDIFKGNEGTMGIVVEITWKIFRYMPQNRQRFGFIFPNWQSAINASREISQGEFGMPAVFRISDPEETHHGLKLYGIEDTIFDKLMTFKGYRPMDRCLMLASSEGEKHFAKNVKKQVKKICRKYGAMYLTAFPVKKWEPGRFKDPYLREDLADFGIIIDTLETSVKWDNLQTVYQNTRDYIKKRPKTIAMTHSSHFYSQGTNLYFIFLIKEENYDNYIKFHRGLIDTIVKSGGSLSHHHGVGRMMRPWMKKYKSEIEMNFLKTMKNYFDPNNIMNPGDMDL